MISKKLQQARDYEREHMGSISPQDRPVFHITPGIGWLNDPNGFSYYNGEYHVFYQYHPYSTEWGPMHWGHVAGKDLLTWDRYPVVMACSTRGFIPWAALRTRVRWNRHNAWR